MRLKITAIPNSKKPSVAKDGDVLKVSVNTSPEKGKANDRLIEILAEYFNISRGGIKIISGHTSRNKTVEVNIN